MSATNQQIRDLLAVLDDRRHTLQQIYATTERALRVLGRALDTDLGGRVHSSANGH